MSDLNESKQKKTNFENPHLGHRERMREKYLKNGIGSFNDHEILEFLLYTVYKEKNTNEISHMLIKKFKSLSGVFAASIEELEDIKGVGKVAALYIKFFNDFKNKMFIAENSAGVVLTNSTVAGQYCCNLFSGCNDEKLYMISLNAKREILSCDIIKEGNDSCVPVDMRKIMMITLKNRAAGVIIAHNHPGDTSHPSTADITVTRKISAVLENMDIALIDHIICSGSTFTSMDDRGMIEGL